MRKNIRDEEMLIRRLHFLRRASHPFADSNLDQPGYDSIMVIRRVEPGKRIVEVRLDRNRRENDLILPNYDPRSAAAST